MKLENCLESEVTLPVDLMIDGKPYRKIVLREVVGLDEEAISQPAYKENAPAMIVELLYRCIADVEGAPRLPNKKEIKNLPVGVLDFIVLELRKVSMGDDFNFTIACINEDCKKPLEGTIKISQIPMKEGSFEDKEVILERGVTVGGKRLKKAIVRVPDGNIQEIFFKKSDFSKFGEVNTELISACLVSIDDQKVDKSTVSAMARIDRKKLSDMLKDLPGPDTMVSLTCPSCGRQFEAPLNVFDFLA